MSAKREVSRVYFPMPETQEVGKPQSTPLVMSPVTNIVGGVSSTIRTESCRPPKSTIYDKRWPETVQYACSKWPTARESSEYVVRQEIHGYSVNSIVARRWSHPMRFLYGHQWGIIIHVFRVPPKGNEPWSPYGVRWFNNSEIEEPAWAEDLIIIHQALDSDFILQIAEEQGVDIDEARRVIEEQSRNNAF
jgi:hypothetical protein